MVYMCLGRWSRSWGSPLLPGWRWCRGRGWWCSPSPSLFGFSNLGGKCWIKSEFMCSGKYESSCFYLTLRKCPPKLVCHSSARPEPVRIGQVSSCKPSVQLIFWANQDVAFNRRFVCLRRMSKATFIGSLIIWQTSDFSLLIYQYFTMHEESFSSQGQYLALAYSQTACFCHWEEIKNRYPQKQPSTAAGQCHACNLASTFWILSQKDCDFSLKLLLFETKHIDIDSDVHFNHKHHKNYEGCPGHSLNVSHLSPHCHDISFSTCQE